MAVLAVRAGPTLTTSITIAIAQSSRLVYQRLAKYTVTLISTVESMSFKSSVTATAITTTANTAPAVTFPFHCSLWESRAHCYHVRRSEGLPAGELKGFSSIVLCLICVSLFFKLYGSPHLCSYVLRKIDSSTLPSHIICKRQDSAKSHVFRRRVYSVILRESGDPELKSNQSDPSTNSTGTLNAAVPSGARWSGSAVKVLRVVLY